MQFSINADLFKKFPSTVLGVVVAHGITNVGAQTAVQTALTNEANHLRTKLTLEQLAEHPNITVWQDVYRAFGAKPKDHRSSIENLCRMVLSGKDLRSINPLVDIYNSISLKYLLPVGGEDLDTIQGDIQLTEASENEAPVLLLGEKEPHAPNPGEVIYKDTVSAICRRWNWREADRTKLTATTRHCVLVIEGLAPITGQTIEAAAQELSYLIRKYCGGTSSYSLLDERRPSVLLTHV